jgi:hypothetical protein
MQDPGDKTQNHRVPLVSVREGQKPYAPLHPYNVLRLLGILIQIDDNGQMGTIAQLNQIDPKTCGVSFKATLAAGPPSLKRKPCQERE